MKMALKQEKITITQEEKEQAAEKIIEILSKSNVKFKEIRHLTGKTSKEIKYIINKTTKKN